MSRLLRRIRVPRDLDAVTAAGPEVAHPATEPIWRAARALYRSGAHPAIQLCVRVDGEVIVDRAIGHASGNGPDDPRDAETVPVTPETPYCVYSASKAVTATVIHLLVERGVLSLDDRVTDYLPAYARHGKQATTIAHLLTHRAGVPFLPRHSTDLDRLADVDFVREVLYDLRPISPPGTTLAYHALSAGYVLGEIVREATGRDIRTVLAEEILRPHGFRWTNYGVSPEDVDEVARCTLTGVPIPAPLSVVVSRALSGSFASAVRKSNDPRFLTATVPSGNVVSNARELARFLDLLRGGGILSPETLRAATRTTAYHRPDHVLAFLPVRYGYGYMLGARVMSLYGPGTDGAFGHLGLMNTVIWADPRRRLAAAIVTSGKGMYYPGVERLPLLLARIGSAVRPLARA